MLNIKIRKQFSWRSPVIRISLPWMIDLAKVIDSLDIVLAGSKIDDHFVPLYDVQKQLEQLYNQSVYSSYLRSSRDKGTELHGVIEAIFDGMNLERTITDIEAAALKTARDLFMIVFRSEIMTLPLYIVTPKESHDVMMLIENGATLFPASLAGKAPEAIRDAMETGKALAFELSTACGFHAFRVTESVVKRYWDEVTEGATRPHLQTLGNYAAELVKNKHGDEKIIESIKMMTRLHRNPIMHPEVILTVEEAINVVGMARSVVGAMLAVLPDAPVTTATPLVAKVP